MNLAYSQFSDGRSSFSFAPDNKQIGVGLDFCEFIETAAGIGNAEGVALAKFIQFLLGRQFFVAGGDKDIIF